MHNISEALMDKLEKLRNLADGAKAVGSLEEADTAAQMFQALLLKHNLDEQAVSDHGIQKKMQMLQSEFDTDEDWMVILLNTIAYYCMCKSVRRKDLKQDGSVCSVFGEKENVAATFYFTEQLMAKISNAYMSSIFRSKTRDSRKTEKQFFLGAVEGVRLKLEKQEREMRGTTYGMEVMLYDKRKGAMGYMHENLGRSGFHSSSLERGNSHDGWYNRGVEAGQQMDLNKGVNGGQKPKTYLS